MPQNDFDTLYLSYQKQMILVAERVLHNRQDAEDAVQTALLRISRQMHCLPENEKARRAYVLTAARHAALDLLPKQRNEADIDAVIVSDNDDLFRQVSASEDYARLLRAIMALPQGYRDVLMLRYVHELQAEDIAVLLGKKRGTVHKQITRAKALLLKQYHKEED